MGVQVLCLGIGTYYAKKEALCNIFGPQFERKDEKLIGC
jgi:hypothetical protein